MQNTMKVSLRLSNGKASTYYINAHVYKIIYVSIIICNLLLKICDPNKMNWVISGYQKNLWNTQLSVKLCIEQINQ